MRGIKYFALMYALLLAVVSFAVPQPAYGANGEDTPTGMVVLTVPAVKSYVLDMTRIYGRERGVRISVFLAESADLVKDISEGGSGDIIITDITADIEKLKNQGLIDVYSQTELARSHLSFICSRQYEGAKAQFPAVLSNIKLALCAAHSCGLRIHAADYLKGHGGDYESTALEAENEDEIKSLVYNGDACGFVYPFSKTDTTRTITVKLEKAPEVTISAAVIAGGDMSEARKFVNFIKGHPLIGTAGLE